jgi:hypothetical protein
VHGYAAAVLARLGHYLGHTRARLRRSRNERSSPDHPLGDAVENFLRREDAERFLAEVRGDDPELAAFLRVEERKLEAGGGN